MTRQGIVEAGEHRPPRFSYFGFQRRQIITAPMTLVVIVAMPKVNSKIIHAQSVTQLGTAISGVSRTLRIVARATPRIVTATKKMPNMTLAEDIRGYSWFLTPTACRFLLLDQRVQIVRALHSSS